MRNRNILSVKERGARSRAAKLVHDRPLIIGSLVEMARTCGKPNCKCTRGEKHMSWYLALRHKGKRKMIHIPRECESPVFEGVKAYQELWEQMDVISQVSLARITQAPKGKE
jgi:hypothetical protein